MNTQTLILLFGFYYATSEMSWKQMAAVCSAMFTGMVYLIYQNQEKLLYMNEAVPPKKTSLNPYPLAHPRQQNMRYEDVFLTTPDGVRLHCWWIPFSRSAKPMTSFPMAGFQTAPHSAATDTHATDEDHSDTDTQSTFHRPTVLFYHANAGNMGFRLPNIATMMFESQVNIFIVSYRGYGDSEGEPSESGLKLDAATALSYLFENCEKLQIDPSKIFVFGRSLGGAVAIHTASLFSERLAGVILENTFTSISDMVKQVFAFLDFEIIKRHMLRLHWKSVDSIDDITCPILFFASTEDEVVPHIQMKELFESAKSAREKIWIPIEGGTHNEGWIKGGDMYWDTFRDFVNRPENVAMSAKSGSILTEDGAKTEEDTGTVDEDATEREPIALPLHSTEL